jgi:hypothetical protein
MWKFVAAVALGGSMLLTVFDGPAFADRKAFCQQSFNRCRECTSRGVTVPREVCHPTCSNRLQNCLATGCWFSYARGERCETGARQGGQRQGGRRQGCVPAGLMTRRDRDRFNVPHC